MNKYLEIFAEKTINTISNVYTYEFFVFIKSIYFIFKLGM